MALYLNCIIKCFLLKHMREINLILITKYKWYKSERKKYSYRYL